ncbi:hypothetical protein G7054_g6252 [Neopestalotiopsis clavispora]|nr:hypothetical protein G7054_g6252 [Neopestalotiopsis clavispora]
MSSTPSSPISPDRRSDKENSQYSSNSRDKNSRLGESSKRKRALTNGAGRANSRRRTEETSDGSGDDDNADDNDSNEYDPDQSIEERRQVQRGLRSLREDARINRDKYLQPGEDGVRLLIQKANALAGSVKQTAEAAIDSRLLVETVELSYKKTALLTSGDAGQGVDVDSFVTQSLRYMRLGAGIQDDAAPELTSTQRQRRQPGRRNQQDSDDEDEIGDDGDLCNWEHLGRFSSLPSIRRSAVSGFLLGPLSVEKKIRKIAKRSAPFRPGALQEVRPEVVDANAIQRKEDSDLTVICRNIFNRLNDVQIEAQEKAEEAYEQSGNCDAIMDSYGLKGTGGLSYFRCVINPRSFGQTVENIFYVSFLIKDERLRLDFDDEGHPTLAPLDDEDRAESNSKGNGSQKHQAIFHLDKAQYDAIIEAYDIKESIIEHRIIQGDDGYGSRNWHN